jgi:hypothetical protein
MNSKAKPAIIGGVIVGLLSAIPFVNIPNLCCCLWAILGGVIASYVYIKGSANPVKVGEGAVLGALAGVIGAVIYVVIGIPLGIVAGGATQGIMAKLMESADPAQAEQLRRQMEAGQSVVGAILFGLLWAVLLILFSTLGGLIAVPIFEKRKGQAAPPPPPNMGGPGYGSGM